MCRSIKTLRPPYLEQVTEEDTQAAALQYVRKISGFRKPSVANQKAFDKAVRDIARASDRLLASLEVRVPA
ncbi:MAG: DUF2277 domain-containing protein [Chloroflexi bacterium]|jgi:hypothetical protein|nr:DUF2277 domain-containing protein [Chloroflexota bacterium]MBT4074039.1 DUF2277 domain-containing protein [Chloroflexota bacterium]MBT4514525.1 DUF2277 domain-containing protein [Chloroflexota bacterium]MBT5320013.1 DUF2277 domain-containing protein [Chloroflexota bacterium]MBT6683189.1 DUF2277 domain-containing protein [Chloroflexota bacterium]